MAQHGVGIIPPEGEAMSASMNMKCEFEVRMNAPIKAFLARQTKACTSVLRRSSKRATMLHA